MTQTASGHWDGDPDRYCGRLTLRAETMPEAAELALLKRVLAAPAHRALLLEAAESIERCAAPETQLVGC